MRLPIDVPALARAAADRGWTSGRRVAFDEGAALHHLLGETFGPAALQPFRLMVAPRMRRGTLYAYAEADAEELRRIAREVGAPEALAALDAARLEEKAMPDVWTPGRRLGFDVRLRPVVRLASEVAPPADRQGGRRHGFRKGAEVDAFLAAALDDPDRAAMANAGRTREEVYCEWLNARLGEAADVERAILAVFRRTLAARGGKAREGPDATLHGTLVVRDSDAFADRLRRGIGRHKAYGYGMLLLRPPQAASPGD